MKIVDSIVSVEWLKNHLHVESLVILDASIPKVGKPIEENTSQLQIPNSRFFDLKNKFSLQNAPFPNTVPSPKQFEIEAQNLGINSDSLVVIYDNLGIYSSPRAWWLFKLMGYENVAVLDGGLPAWKKEGHPLEIHFSKKWSRGNFKVNFQSNLVTTFEEIQLALKTSTFKIIDARSENRFNGLESEPRKGLRSGKIPNSFNLPYSIVIEATSLLNASRLQSIFNNFVEPEDTLVFSCGSGVTACILALAGSIAGYDTISVYDGSWTEYGSSTEA